MSEAAISTMLAKALGELPSDGSRPNRLHEAVRYVVDGGGKLLRGRLVVALASDLRGVEGEEGALPAALAVEYVHAASLVHDDLPALDNDDVRRGKPSCHRAFDEATAILAGDYLVGLAFARLSDLKLSAEMNALAVRQLSTTWMQLCSGQQVDLLLANSAGRESSLEVSFEEMMELKTGALFGCSAALGGIVGGVDAVTVDRLNRWGRELGVLFQRIDNVLDEESSPATLNGLEEQARRLIEELSKVTGAQHPRAQEAVKAITSLDRCKQAA